MRLPRSEELRRRLRSRRVPGLRTVKLTLAAVLAYVLASRLDTSPDRVLAPLTALLVVQATLYSTLRHALGRTVSVLTGVGLAVVVADLVGLTWWSLGLVVLVSLTLGQVLRLGQHLMEAPISAMIVLALGGQAGSAAGRVTETVLGGAVGLLVNLVIAPPVQVQPAEAALDRVATRLADVLEDLAVALREGWSRERAAHHLDRARGLHAVVDRADRDLQRAEESARLNPRGARARVAQPRLRTALTSFEHTQVSLRNLCRTLLDRTLSLPADLEHVAYDEAVREALADVLADAGQAVRCAGTLSATADAPDGTLEAVTAALSRLREDRDRLARMLLVDPATDEGAWQQHGALLAGVDRLRVEVEAAVHPQDMPWRPEPLARRQRDAVRAAVRGPRPARPWRRR